MSVSFREHLERGNMLPTQGYEITESGNDMEQIVDGLVFVHATWSAPSVLCWQILGRVVHELHLPPSLWVVDVDTVSPEVAESALNCRFEGWGETFLFRKGGIVGRTQYGPKYEDSLKRLFSHS